MNYLCFGGWFWLHYAYFDSNSYLADSLLCKHEVPVRFGDEYERSDSKYRIIFCKVRKKYKNRFERAMLELNNKMLICGYNDYEEFCKKIGDAMKHGAETVDLSV